MNTLIINPPQLQWPELIKRPLVNNENLEQTVSEIINNVKQTGDEAIKKYSLQFHGFAPDNLWITKDEIKNASKSLDKNLKKAIHLAKDNIEKFHQSQIEKVKKITTLPGVTCWRKNVPIEKVGLYIPGGSAPLFSTLLMLAIPAKIAGCKNIIVTTPAQIDGKISNAILYVADILGIDKIYKSGGAQAIAALAYGTQTLEKVYKIFGPGNQYVTCAKKLVNANGIAIDMLAGPSELAVYADDTCVPEFVAADLLSQAEHGSDSQVVLIAPYKKIIEKIIDAIHQQLPLLSRKNIIEQSFLNRRFIVIKKKEEAFEFLNEYAPEHLIIASKKAYRHGRYITNAGSVFLGNLSAESAGDYASGTNHSLPTNGYAKTHSGVSVDSFVKKIAFQKINKKGIKNIGNAVEVMAEAEGLEAHKNAISIRLKQMKN